MLRTDASCVHDPSDPKEPREQSAEASAPMGSVSNETQATRLYRSHAVMCSQEAARSEALVFVMELVVEGRAAVPVSTGDAILSMLAQLPPAATLAKAGDRESLFVAVLKALYAQGLPAGMLQLPITPLEGLTCQTGPLEGRLMRRMIIQL